MKQLAKSILRRFGLTIIRTSEWAQIFKTLEIENVFDVGANKGQYGEAILNGGYSGNIVSFEPISEAHTELSKISKKYENWLVHPRCAIGDSSKTVSLNISKNSYSSSLLPMLPSHLAAAPSSIYVGQEEVEMITLDSLIEDYQYENKRNFLKIDVQGAEKLVLDGATQFMKSTHGIQVEVSSIPLYEGEASFDLLNQMLNESGFFLWDIKPEFRHPKTGQLLQFDAFFVSKKLQHSIN